MRNRLLTTCRPSASDSHLARRAAAGDDDAFDKLYERYQPRLEAYCRSIVRHDEDARDAVQSAMTNALVALRRDNDPSNVQGWLFRIAHNEAISLLRRRRATTELADVMHDSRLGPAGDLLMREELRATLDGVRALPGNLQHPLLLRELAGLSYGQVAEVVGGTPAAARKAVFDARTALTADRAGRDEACSVIRQSLSEGDGRRRRARVVRSHLQSCNACCEWESAQRQRRHHLASLLPAASAAGSAGGWLAGLFGGGSTIAAGVSGSVAANAKIAATLALIAASAAPVVERVEHADEPPAKLTASARSTAMTARAARRAVTGATARLAAATNVRARPTTDPRADASTATRVTRRRPSDTSTVQLRRAENAAGGGEHTDRAAADKPPARAPSPNRAVAAAGGTKRPGTASGATAPDASSGGSGRARAAASAAPRGADKPAATLAAQPRRAQPEPAFGTGTPLPAPNPSGGSAHRPPTAKVSPAGGTPRISSATGTSNPAGSSDAA